jgi:hypothetical protein
MGTIDFTSTLYLLASSAEYKTIGNLFGVGKSTVYSIVHKVCEAIYENLLNVYVKFRTGDELKNVVRVYEESWGFPNCGGAINGTHIPIIAPSESHGDYLNRKDYYSLKKNCLERREARKFLGYFV